MIIKEERMPQLETQQQMSSPIEQLKADHEVIQRALNLMNAVVDQVESGQLVASEIYEGLAMFFAEFVDGYHHRKEEEGLFPMLEQAGIPRESGPVGMMLCEHEKGREFIQVMVQNADGGRPTAAGAKDYIVFWRAHLEKENRVLFPMANEILPDDVKQEMLKTFQHIKEEQLGDRRYQECLDSLSKMETTGVNPGL